MGMLLPAYCFHVPDTGAVGVSSSRKRHSARTDPAPGGGAAGGDVINPHVTPTPPSWFYSCSGSNRAAAAPALGLVSV